MIEVTPPDFVELAARTGFDGVSLMLEFPGGPLFPMGGDTPMRRETKRRLDDTGTILVDASTFRLEPATVVEGFRPMIESAAYLGARQINACGNDADTARVTENFAALCALAAEHGLAVGLEFQIITPVRTVADALRLIDASGATNAAVTVDALHLMRSGGTPADVAGLARPQVAYLQLCDGPAVVDADRHQWESGTERMLPGEGEFPLGELVGAVGPDVVIGAEVPSQSRREAGVPNERYAALVLESLRAVVGRA